MLYVVATPIGNLGDITQRAREVLESVDLIAAEDTRQTGKLLTHLNIDTQVVAYHAHNESGMTGKLLERIKAGESIALVSDAGTPLVSDPGYSLVDAALVAGVKVVPIPGASAVTTALSVAGLPVEGFAFEGFLPAKKGARRKKIQQLETEPRTLVFYEAPHRIAATLEDLRDVLGGDRSATICRELTKAFEQVVRADLGELCESLDKDIPCRGEFVVVVEGAREVQTGTADVNELVRALLKELPPSKIAGVLARVVDMNRNDIYELAMRIKQGN